MLLKPRRIEFLFLRVQVSIHFDKLRNALFNLIPIQKHFDFFAVYILRDFDAFAIVHFINARSGNDGVRTAPTVFIFQEIHIFFLGKALLKLLIDAELSLRHAASTGENGVDNLLRKGKSRGFRYLCFVIEH